MLDGGFANESTCLHRSRKGRHRDFDEPRPKEGELLVKITNVGICGSDMHAYLGHDDRRPAPLILGQS